MEALQLEKRVNKFAIIIITIIDAFMMFGYVSDFRKGNISMGYMLMVEILVLTTMVISYVARVKWPTNFKHISLVGYMLVYALCVFGSHNDAVFTILFPIAVIYILYFNYVLKNHIHSNPVCKAHTHLTTLWNADNRYFS